jgi:flagellum-specific ATP synthase
MVSSQISPLKLENLGEALSVVNGIRQYGSVVQMIGDLIEADAPAVTKGAYAQIGETVCEVVGFRGTRALLMPLDRPGYIEMGAKVEFRTSLVSVPVGEELLGRVIDPLGREMDGLGALSRTKTSPLIQSAPNPMKRAVINEPLRTGVRVIDGFLTLGEGQRISIMAGSGVGKSTLMGMFARNSSADVNVIALVGERGREVREFIERDLGEGLSKSVVVVSTSDVSPALQIKGVQAAMSIAEYFRDTGKSVLVLTDSLTRLAMAQRQIGLSAGEPPTSKGYPPSVFTLLPRLLERGGKGVDGSGSITSISTVLIEADDINDPIGDTVRSIVDGHIVLSRRLVSYGHYPPVDVLESLSRTMPYTVNGEHLNAATEVRRIMAIYAENEELIRLGAYKRGTDPTVDMSIQLKRDIDDFLRQDREEFTPFEDCQAQLTAILTKAQKIRPNRKKPKTET